MTNMKKAMSFCSVHGDYPPPTCRQCQEINVLVKKAAAMVDEIPGLKSLVPRDQAEFRKRLDREIQDCFLTPEDKVQLNKRLYVDW